MIILINLPLISAFFRLEKELSTFLTWLERCEAIDSSPEMDISADRVKVESELQSIQASSSSNFLLLWLWGFPTPLVLNDFLVYCTLTFLIYLPKSCSSETVTVSCPEDREQSSVHIEEKSSYHFINTLWGVLRGEVTAPFLKNDTNIWPYKTIPAHLYTESKCSTGEGTRRRLKPLRHPHLGTVSAWLPPTVFWTFLVHPHILALCVLSCLA